MNILSPKFKLSDKELTIYSMLALGHSQLTVASHLNVPKSEVHEIVLSVSKRLSVPTVCHAVLLLIVFGHVKPDYSFFFSALISSFFEWLHSLEPSMAKSFPSVLYDTMIRFRIDKESSENLD